MIPLPIFNVQSVEQISTAIYDPLFTKEECEGIIEQYRSDEPITAMVNGEVVDPKRDTLIHPIPYDESSEALYMKLTDRVARMNQFSFDFDISGIYGDLQLLEYTEGMHYDWHMDMGPGQAALRKLTMVAQLSDPDDYEGGEVHFKASEKEHTLPKTQGQLVVFPSYVLHKVDPIISGTRFSLVTFVLSHRRFR